MKSFAEDDFQNVVEPGEVKNILPGSAPFYTPVTGFFLCKSRSSIGI